MDEFGLGSERKFCRDFSRIEICILSLVLSGSSSHRMGHFKNKNRNTRHRSSCKSTDVFMTTLMNLVWYFILELPSNASRHTSSFLNDSMKSSEYISVMNRWNFEIGSVNFQHKIVLILGNCWLFVRMKFYLMFILLVTRYLLSTRFVVQ